MAKTTIDVGSNANDGTGDDLRSAFISVNANLSARTGPDRAVPSK